MVILSFNTILESKLRQGRRGREDVTALNIGLLGNNERASVLTDQPSKSTALASLKRKGETKAGLNERKSAIVSRKLLGLFYPEGRVLIAMKSQVIKVFGVAVGLLLLTAPARAVEYQGKNVDGVRLPAKVLLYKTGGEYDVEVMFKQNLATIYFPQGEQTTIRLTQRIITDPNNVEGIGKLGQVYVGNTFRVGLDFDRSNDTFAASNTPALDYTWLIRLDPASLNQVMQQ